MKTMTVAYLKAHFSSVLKNLRQGEETVIEFGKRREKLGVLVPYNKYRPVKRKVGILSHKNASFKIVGDFKISDEELLAP